MITFLMYNYMHIYLFVLYKNVYYFDRYKQNVKKLYQTFKDRPMSPNALVTYWTDYVINHNGTEHMHSASNKMCWYQYHNLDIILVIILVVISLLVIVLYTLTIITRSIIKYFHLKQIKTE